MTTKSFADLGLAEPLQRVLQEREYHTPTPIQAQAIPELLNRHDVLGIAQTGTGKTAAFALPILNRLADAPPSGKNRAIRAVVLAPTRELASQIGKEIRAYGKFLHFRQSVIFGGVKQHSQVQALQRGVDILVATPGRLLDLMNQKHVSLDQIEFLVLDEADRMLDMGFINDIRKIIATTPKSRQSLLFSATMPPKIEKLSQDFLTDPARVEVAVQATPIERITQSVYHVESSKKRALLIEILGDASMSRVIVFTRTKHRADRVASDLEKSGIKAVAIHGNKSQNARQRSLNQFKSGNARVLVATDIAARGIDVDNVSHVVNFELPNEPESYVHRIGRTARAGAAGAAISFCDGSERAYLRDIERITQTRIAQAGATKGWSPIPQSERTGDDERPRPSRPNKTYRKRRPNRDGQAPQTTTERKRKPHRKGRRRAA